MPSVSGAGDAASWGAQKLVSGSGCFSSSSLVRPVEKTPASPTWGHTAPLRASSAKGEQYGGSLPGPTPAAQVSRAPDVALPSQSKSFLSVLRATVHLSSFRVSSISSRLSKLLLLTDSYIFKGISRKLGIREPVNISCFLDRINLSSYSFLTPSAASVYLMYLQKQKLPLKMSPLCDLLPASLKVSDSSLFHNAVCEITQGCFGLNV